MRMARLASSSGAGCLYFGARRYLRTTPATPRELSHSATSLPSCSVARKPYPPPGQITIDAPVTFSFGGR